MQGRTRERLGKIATVLMSAFFFVCILAGGFVLYNHFAKTDDPLTEPVMATVTKGTNNIYSVNKNTAKTLGSSDNPFMLLEIVPAENMGTMATLFDGTELTVDVPEYGHFVYTGTTGGDYVYKLTDIDVQMVDDHSGNYDYVKVSSSDPEMEPDPSVASIAEAVKWQSVPEGTGLFSTVLYKYYGALQNGADYSLNYVKASGGNYAFYAEPIFSTSSVLPVDVVPQYGSHIFGYYRNWSLGTAEFVTSDYLVRFMRATAQTSPNAVRYSPKAVYNYHCLVDVTGNVTGTNAYRNYTYSGGSYISNPTILNTIPNTNGGRDNLANPLSNYYVLFEQDDDGDYVVDTSTQGWTNLNTSSNLNNNLYAASSYSSNRFAYAGDGGYYLQDGGGFNKLTDGNVIPMEVGTYTEKLTGKTIYMGEYSKGDMGDENRVYITPGATLPITVTLSNGNTVSSAMTGDIGNRNYDRYVLQKINNGSVKVTFSYGMVPAATAGTGTYSWVTGEENYTYEEAVAVKGYDPLAAIRSTAFTPAPDEYAFYAITKNDEPTAYGHFEYVGPGNGDYSYKFVGSVVEEVAHGTGNLDYKKVTADNINTLTPDVDEDDPYAYKWEQVPEGEGVFSDVLYSYIGKGSTGADYSLLYEYVGSNGDMTFGESPIYGSQMDYPDGPSRRSNMWYLSENDFNMITFYPGDYLVQFVYAGNTVTDQQRYRVKSSYAYNYPRVSISGHDEWNNSNPQYRIKKNYIMNNGHFLYRVGQMNCNHVIGGEPYSGYAIKDEYFVVFEAADDGDYVVYDVSDYTVSWDNLTTIASSYDIVDYTLGWKPATGADADYKTLAGAQIPKEVGDITFNGTTYYLGEYSKETLSPTVGGELIKAGVELSNGDTAKDTDKGNLDWNKYVLVATTAGDYASYYSYDMVEETGGAYKWIGMDSDMTFDRAKQLFGSNPFEQISATPISMAYDYYAGYELKIRNSEASLLNGSNQFKKYAIGLAYNDNDYTKGEVDQYTNAQKAVLEGKLSEYKVDVVTVTPDDFVNSDSGETSANKAQKNIENLIGKADMIVINQTISDELLAKYTELHPSVSATRTTFAKNDLSADATLAIFKRSIGVGGKPCPVVYDYTIFTTIEELPSSDSNVEGSISVKGTFSDGSTITKTAKGYNYNLYKLYMMSREMNSITFYNSYMGGTKKIYDNSVVSVNGSNIRFAPGTPTTAKPGAGITISGDARDYWTSYTFLPYSAMTKQEWDLAQDSAVPNLGINLEIGLALSTSNITNRFYTYNYVENGEAISFAESFSYKSFPSLGEDDINLFMHPTGTSAAPAAYRTRDIAYYLLHAKSEDDSYAKDINILEIQPYNHAKPDSYWFWYISRFVGNFTGTYTVKSMNSSEFVGNVDDLNSQYDVIFIGADMERNDEIKNYLPADSTQYVNAGAEVTLPVTQTINFAFSKATGSVTKTKYRFISDSTYKSLSPSQKQQYPYECGNCDFDITIDRMGHATLSYDRSKVPDMLNLDFDYASGAPNNNNGYYFFSKDPGDYASAIRTAWNGTASRNVPTDNYVRNITFTVDQDPDMIDISGGLSNNQIINQIEFQTQSNWQSGMLGRLSVSLYVQRSIGRFHLNTLHYGQVQITEVESYSSGTKVNAGETIKNTTSNRQTIYTTNYMYTHTGRRVSNLRNHTRQNYEEVSKLRGLLTDNGTGDSIDDYVYSGNDITSLKMRDLLDFVKAGYPIIISKDLLDGDNRINTDMVDSSSYMYEFLNRLITDTEAKKTTFVDSDTTQDVRFRAALNNKSFHLKVVYSPVDYKEYQDLEAYTTLREKYQDYNSETATESQRAAYESDWGMFYKDYYVNGQNINNKQLEYSVIIQANGEAARSDHYYELRLFVDLNANGRYDITDERLDSLEVQVMDTGQHVSTDRLVANVQYRITRDMSDFVGAIPWKLQIFDVSNDSVRDQVLGICAMRVDNPKSLNILQIIPDAGSVVFLATDSEIAAARRDKGIITHDNMATYFQRGNNGSYIDGTNLDNDVASMTNSMKNKTAGMFYYYITSMNEFDIHFFRITVSEFEQAVNRNPSEYTNKKYDIRGTANVELTERSTGNKYPINMMIIGFGDKYGNADFDDEAARNTIIGFTEAGNTVLFTHDTTSNWVNPAVATSNLEWGTEFSKDVRDLFGMDRYNVTTNHGRISSMAEAVDAPWDLGSTSRTAYYESNANGNSNDARRALAQGYTNYCIAEADSNVSNNWFNPEDNANRIRGTKSNEGQLVCYPYDVGDNIELSPTHAQYYQLDLENDEVVVWYTLSNNPSSDNIPWHRTKNDVRNNYYIYNVGNIIYSGVGHSGDITEDETKLFVNTMAYSYLVGGAQTVTTVQNADITTMNNVYMYVDYDATVELSKAKALGEDVTTISQTISGEGDTAVITEPQLYRIRFKLTNYSAAVNKMFILRLYPAKLDENGKKVPDYDHPLAMTNMKAGTITSAGVAEPAGTRTYIYSGPDEELSFTGYELQLAGNYYADVPLYSEFYEDEIGYSSYGMQLETFGENDDFKNQTSDEIEIIAEATMFYGRYSVNNLGQRVYKSEPITGVTNLILMRRGSFLLD